MKKIGVITFHSAHNYGAMLQVYALQNKINDNEVKIINYRNKKIDGNYKVFKPLKGKLLVDGKQIVKDIYLYRKNIKRYRNFESYMNQKLSLTDKYDSENNLRVNPPKFDIYITGSDQVWNPNIVGKVSDAYTLNFGSKNVKRISYAASIGSSNIKEKYIEDYKNKLEKIDYISVREEDAKKALQGIIDKPIEVVLDPTLLLTREEWNEEIKNCEKENEKYILAYVVQENEEYRKIVNYLSKVTGLKVIHFEKRNKYDNVLRSAYTEGPQEFVNLIKNAEYVVATSFHATVFSIIFNKKFFIVPHSETGSRVTNLLKKLRVEDRVFYNLEDFKKIDYNFETDWNVVERILEKERQKSINWLKNAIEG